MEIKREIVEIWPFIYFYFLCENLVKFYISLFGKSQKMTKITRMTKNMQFFFILTNKFFILFYMENPSMSRKCFFCLNVNFFQIYICLQVKKDFQLTYISTKLKKILVDISFSIKFSSPDILF